MDKGLGYDPLFHFDLLGHQVDMFHLARNMRFLELKDVYQRIKRPETRLEKIIALLRQSLKPVENEAIKERVLSYVLYQEDLETSQKLLGTSSPTGCYGLGSC